VAKQLGKHLCQRAVSARTDLARLTMFWTGSEPGSNPANFAVGWREQKTVAC